MSKKLSLLLLFVLVSSGITEVAAQDPTEGDYYKILTLPIPTHIVLEGGAVEELPGKKIAVASRRGDIYIVENAFSDPVENVEFKLFASGLHEVLGLAYRDGWLYATQRCELTRIKDTDGDGRADLFETVSDGWEINGDYHEYAFGSRFDKEGNIWIVLCLTGSSGSSSKFRGWCVRVTKDGKMIPTCSGIRSPGGIGMNATGDMFYTDNQGLWNGTCALKHLKPGSFQGNPSGFKWFDVPGVVEAMGARPETPKSGSRMLTESKKIPKLLPPAILFPYKKMGQSASGIVSDKSGGKFGAFNNQTFVGDQTHSSVMRCFLEKVDGEYQGACFPFRFGFDSGSLGMLTASDGSMFVGSTNRGWGARGGKPFALQRLVWTGKTAFEVHEMRAKPDGFELTFTEPVDATTAVDPKSYELSTYTYIYQSGYGSPEVDRTTPTITKVEVGKDGKSARLYVEKLQEGHVHELHMNGVRSAKGVPLLHKEAYYTLNAVPSR